MSYRLSFSITVLKRHFFEIFTLDVGGKIELFLHDNQEATITQRISPTRIIQIIHSITKNKVLDDLFCDCFKTTGPFGVGFWGGGGGGGGVFV